MRFPAQQISWVSGRCQGGQDPILHGPSLAPHVAASQQTETTLVCWLHQPAAQRSQLRLGQRDMFSKTQPNSAVCHCLEMCRSPFTPVVSSITTFCGR